MQGEMSHFKTHEIKTYRCYFPSSVVLCIFFSIFCCGNERKIVVLIFHHQRPFDFLATMWDTGGSLLHPFFLMFGGGICMPFLDIPSMAEYIISCFCGPHRNQKKKKVLGLQEESKMVLLSLHIIALKMLRYAVGNIAATSNPIAWIGPTYLWAGFFFCMLPKFFSSYISFKSHSGLNSLYVWKATWAIIVVDHQISRIKEFSLALS